MIRITCIALLIGLLALLGAALGVGAYVLTELVLMEQPND